MDDRFERLRALCKEYTYVFSPGIYPLAIDWKFDSELGSQRCFDAVCPLVNSPMTNWKPINVDCGHIYLPFHLMVIAGDTEAMTKCYDAVSQEDMVYCVHGGGGIKSPLELAIMYHSNQCMRVQVIKTLLGLGCIKRGADAIHQILLEFDLTRNVEAAQETIRMLLEGKCVPHEYDRCRILRHPCLHPVLRHSSFPVSGSDLISQVEQRNYASVAVLLQRGVSPNPAPPLTHPLVLCCTPRACSKMAELLLAGGADPFRTLYFFRGTRVEKIRRQLEDMPARLADEDEANAQFCRWRADMLELMQVWHAVQREALVWTCKRHKYWKRAVPGFRALVVAALSVIRHLPLDCRVKILQCYALSFSTQIREYFIDLY